MRIKRSLRRGGEGGNPAEAFAKGGDSDRQWGARILSPLAIIRRASAPPNDEGHRLRVTFLRGEPPPAFLMSNSEELRRRFQRVGRQRPPAAARAETVEVPARGLPPGDEIATPSGVAYRLETLYPLRHEHGRWPLHAVLSYEPGLAADVAQQTGLLSIAPDQLAYLDTETTGLAGGAGTLVFLIGIGRFVEDGFRLRQYFLRDPAEEPAMLLALQEDLEAAGGFVTFNGQRFDMPLLEMRYVTGLRRRWRLTNLPQLDLLFPARRLWRHRLPDCSLATLEAELLGVHREELDISGAEIPGIYLDYLRSGRTQGIRRIVYHNAQDVLSLVGLTAHVLDRHATDTAGLAEGEALALARWHDRLGRPGEAERYYLAALETADPWTRREALSGYTMLLKSSGRRAEAISGLDEWGSLAPDDPTPAIELAKYYEWQERDYGLARLWAERAQNSLEAWPVDWRRNAMQEAIQHRLARLRRKGETG